MTVKSLLRQHFYFDDAYGHRHHHILKRIMTYHHRRLHFCHRHHHHHVEVIISCYSDGNQWRQNDNECAIRSSFFIEIVSDAAPWYLSINTGNQDSKPWRHKILYPCEQSKQRGSKFSWKKKSAYEFLPQLSPDWQKRMGWNFLGYLYPKVLFHFFFSARSRYGLGIEPTKIPLYLIFS